jgi:Baseplate J-like protein
MSAVLPNLDDRRWTDLVEEGRALIPVYSPGWTDHNVHDPGITVLELLAWLTETDIFRINRVPDRHRRKLLALVGIHPESPRPARGVLRLSITGDEPLALPEGVEFTTRSTPPTPFRTLEASTLVPGEIRAVQSADASGFRDLTRPFVAGEPFLPFGTAPEPGAALYLGFDRSLPVGEWTNLFFSVPGERTGREESDRIRGEARAREKECRPQPENPCLPDGTVDSRTGPDWGESAVRSHHAVRTAWEYLSAAHGRWVGLDPARGEVEDRTRAFTLDGVVRLRLPGPIAAGDLGAIEDSFHWVRARFAAGAYDAVPEILDVSLNGVPVEQAVAASVPLLIAPKADLPDPPPKPSERVALRIGLDAGGRIEKLRREGSPDDPRFLVLAYEAPLRGAEGHLRLEAVWLGAGAGLPRQSFELPFAPAEKRSLRIFALDQGGVWKEWEARPDLDASGPQARSFVLDPEASLVAFGDGRRGAVPQVGSHFFATYRFTRAGSGNVSARAIDALADSPRNRVLVSDWSGMQEALASIRNPLAAQGGADAEGVSGATGRAVEMMQTPMRAVTLADYERLARETPGVKLARVTARANLHPALPCNRAPGVVTLILLPELPERRPFPSGGLKRLVKAYLERRRVIGTRLEVVGPSYHPVTIRSRVAPERSVEASALRARIVEALHRFFDPLRGGPEKTGWPFGRDVYRAEVLRVIDAVPGVDHVLSLDLLSEGCEPECGSVCVGATGLVASGDHEIEVISDRETS